MRINVAYACNEAYIEQTTISLISLFENNKEFSEIYVYFIDMGVTPVSATILVRLAESYDRVLKIIPFNSIAYDLSVRDTGRHIQSVYAKIFFGRLDNIDKVLYLDSDIIVANTLMPLWEVDLGDCVCAGVETLHTIKDNELMGLTREDRAINDGVVLMNLSKWRDGDYLNKCLAYIDAYDGNPPVLSEGTINNVCKGKIKIVHPRYNLMTGIVNEKQNKLEILTGRKYYSQKQLEQASNNPCIIHYLSGFYNRPWNTKCTHPLKHYYLKYKAISIYKDKPLGYNILPIRIRMIGFLYRYLPITLFIRIRSWLMKR